MNMGKQKNKAQTKKIIFAKALLEVELFKFFDKLSDLLSIRYLYNSDE